MDNRAEQLKTLFLNTVKNLDPQMAEQALSPEGDKVVSAACEGLVAAFDILNTKPSA